MTPLSRTTRRLIVAPPMAGTSARVPHPPAAAVARGDDAAHRQRGGIGSRAAIRPGALLAGSGRRRVGLAPGAPAVFLDWLLAHPDMIRAGARVVDGNPAPGRVPRKPGLAEVGAGIKRPLAPLEAGRLLQYRLSRAASGARKVTT